METWNYFIFHSEHFLLVWSDLILIHEIKISVSIFYWCKHFCPFPWIISQDGRGDGLRLMKPSGCCRATNLYTQSTYTDSPTPVAPLMGMPSGLERWTTRRRTTLFAPRQTQTCSTDKDLQHMFVFFVCFFKRTLEWMWSDRNLFKMYRMNWWAQSTCV